MPRQCAAPKCENTLEGKRVDARYCSSACKLDAYHARRGITTRRERDYEICQRAGCDNVIPYDRRADSKWCSNACRQRVWHETHKDETQAKRDKARLAKIAAQAKKEEKKAVDEFIQELIGK